jgi:hypothetical protein
VAREPPPGSIPEAAVEGECIPSCRPEWIAGGGASTPAERGSDMKNSLAFLIASFVFLIFALLIVASFAPEVTLWLFFFGR